MTLKFPSGRVSITARELGHINYRQPSCAICDKRWIIASCGCINGRILVLHPCQHLVGSGCWSTVPNGQRDRCPVCKVGIQCEEGIGVTSVLAVSTPESQVTNLEEFGWEGCANDGDAFEYEAEYERAEEWTNDGDPFQDGSEYERVEERTNDGDAPEHEGENERKEDIETIPAEGTELKKARKRGLKDNDVVTIKYFIDLRAWASASHVVVSTIDPSIETLTLTHRKRLVLFLANTPQCKQETEQKSV